MLGIVESGVIAGMVRFVELVRRFGFGVPSGAKGAPPRFGVPAGEGVRSSEPSSFLDCLLCGCAASAASAFARWKASYKLPTCERYGLKAEGSMWGICESVTGGMSLMDGGRWLEEAVAVVWGTMPVRIMGGVRSVEMAEPELALLTQSSTPWHVYIHHCCSAPSPRPWCS